MSKWIEIDELEKTNNKLDEINEKITLIYDYFNKALNLEILASLFDILQKNYIKLTAHNIQPNDLIAPHLYDLSFNGVNQYAVIGLQPDGSGTSFTVYGWNEMTIEELIYPVYPKIRTTVTYWSMIGDHWTERINTRLYATTGSYYEYLDARFSVMKPDGSYADYFCGFSDYKNLWVHIIRMFNSNRIFTVWINTTPRCSYTISTEETTILERNPDTAPSPQRYKRFVLGASTRLDDFMVVRYSYVRIYSRALTSDEISAAINSKVVSTSGLKVFIDPTFWDRTKYVDLSGNGNHAYPYNNPQRVDATNKWMYIIRNIYSDGYVRFLLPKESFIFWNIGKIESIECVEPMFFDGTRYWCLHTTTYKGDSATIYIPQ